MNSARPFFIAGLVLCATILAVDPPVQAGSSGIFLDFDGTLSEIVARPELAGPTAGATEAVSSLVGPFRVVAVVSGRPAREVEDLLRVRGVRYEGGYGLRDAGAIADAEAEVRAAAATAPGIEVEVKPASIAVHYRAAADPAAARSALKAVLSSVATGHGLEVIEAKRVLELVPAGAPRKGGVIERIARDAGLTGALFAGDDLPDLEAFEAMDRLSAAGVMTVKVSVSGAETPEELSSAADVEVEGPSGLVELLRSLTEGRRARTASR
jgi:trehalose 6-phosphate phosphatase